MLQIRNLTIDYRARHGAAIRAVEDLTFDLAEGEVVGVLGPSGCGKTTLARAVLRVLPAGAIVVEGCILLEGMDILRAGAQTLQQIRGAQVAIVFQEPALALNPVMRVSEQVAEVVRAHRDATRSECMHQAAEALSAVQLREKRLQSAYPHELSAGQRQRVVLAQALVCKPRLLIADEPTSSLDSTTQSEILNLLAQLKSQFKLSILLITHNPALLTGLAERALIMRYGRIVEQGALPDLGLHPNHPYARELFQSIQRC